MVNRSQNNGMNTGLVLITGWSTLDVTANRVTSLHDNFV